MARPKLASILFVIGIYIVVPSVNGQSIDPPSAQQDCKSQNEKLDKILIALDSISVTLNQLTSKDSLTPLRSNKNAPSDSSSPGNSINPVEDQIEEQKQHHKIAANNPIIDNNNVKRDSKAAANEVAVDETHSKDMFRFNNLATLDSLPINIFGQADSTNDVVAMLGQYYETVFGDALNNLSSLVKQQLAAFRMTLNKLMNRLVDNAYQYNVIHNHLEAIKEECTMAASRTDSLNLTNFCLVDQKQLPSANPAPVTTSPDAVVGAGTIRSSDIATIVHLLSQELGQMMARQSAAGVAQVMDSKPGDQSDSVVTLSTNSNESTSRLLIEVQGLSKKMSEMDSVVKQSVLLLNRMHQAGNSQSFSSRNRLKDSNVELVYTNADNDRQSTLLEQQNATAAPVVSRWFLGSKVPGLKAGSRNDTAPLRGNSVWCQSKTNLIKPTSCRQLRLAGANCTGQYYVFLRGSIRHVYCDMNMDSRDQGGGWTVVLKRIDRSLQRTASSVTPANDARVVSTTTTTTNNLIEPLKASQMNFTLDWYNYKLGFGDRTAWGEFFAGLDMLHLLTTGTSGTNKPDVAEMQLDLTTSESKELHLRFDEFRVDNEAAAYEMHVKGCNSTDIKVCEPISRLTGLKFFSPIDNSTVSTANSSNTCEKDAYSGWWRQAEDCTNQSLSLMAPIGRGINGEVRHLYWPNWEHSREPLREIVLKVRKRQG